MKTALNKLPPTAERSVLNYLEEKTVKTHGKIIRTSRLYYQYRKWAWLKAISTVSAKRFFAIVEQHGYRQRSTPHGKVYRNLSFTEGDTP